MAGQEIIYRINGRELTGIIDTVDMNGFFVKNTFGGISFVARRLVIVIL